MSKVKELLNVYWLPHLLFTFAMIGYALLSTAGLVLVTTQGLGVGINGDSSTPGAIFYISVTFESRDLQNPVTWDPVVVKTNRSMTLLAVLNASVVLTGDLHPAGFYISGINNISEHDNFYWQIYYFQEKNGWIYSSAGASSLVASSDSFFRMIFDF